MIKREMYMKRIRPFIGTELISELLQLAKGWSNLVSNRIIIWRLHYIDDRMLLPKNAKALFLQTMPLHQSFISQ